MKGWRWHHLALRFPAIFSPKPFPSSPFHTPETGLVTLSTAGCLYIYLRCFLFCSVSQCWIRKSGLKSPRSHTYIVSILIGFLIWSQGPDRCSLNLVPWGLLFFGITIWMWNVIHTLKGVPQLGIDLKWDLPGGRGSLVCGRGRWSPMRFLCWAPFAVLSLPLYCGCRVSRHYMFMALQLPGHEELWSLQLWAKENPSSLTRLLLVFDHSKENSIYCTLLPSLTTLSPFIHLDAP